MIYSTTWVSLENTVLSERSKTQKATHCMITMIRNVQVKQVQRQTESQGLGWEGREGDEEWGVTVSGYEVSLQDDENVLALASGDGCTTM